MKRHISHAHESPRCCPRLHQDSPARAAEQEETENPITAQRSLDHAFCAHRTKDKCCLRPVKQGRKHVHPATPPTLAGHLPACPFRVQLWRREALNTQGSRPPRSGTAPRAHKYARTACLTCFLYFEAPKPSIHQATTPKPSKKNPSLINYHVCGC